MQAVEQLEMPGTRAVTFAKDQPEYSPLPALLYEDGKILTEWTFSEEERAAIAQGENLRLWIWKGYAHACPHCHQAIPTLLQPVQLQLTDERIA